MVKHATEEELKRKRSVEEEAKPITDEDVNPATRTKKEEELVVPPASTVPDTEAKKEGAQVSSDDDNITPKPDDHPLVIKLKKIRALLDTEEVEKRLGVNDRFDFEDGASEDELKKLEDKICPVPLPEEIKAVLTYANGARLPANLWIPSIEEMLEHWGYNSAYAPVFTQKKAVPWGMIDYDFCWRVMQADCGVIWTIDGECGTICCEGSLEELLDDLITSMEDGKDGKIEIPEGVEMTNGFGVRLWEAVNRQWE